MPLHLVRLAGAFLFTFGVFLGPGWAHEGPHGGEEPPALAAVRPGERVAASDAEVDVAVVLPEGRRGTLEVWLADAEDSGPWTGSGVAVLRQLPGGRVGRTRLAADPAVPGRHAAEVAWPAGRLVLTVARTGKDGREVRLALPPVVSAGQRIEGWRPRPWLLGLPFLGVLLVLGIRRARRPAASVVVLAMAVASGGRAEAHGGEAHDHGAEAPVRARAEAGHAHGHHHDHAHHHHGPPEVEVPLEVQFAMDLRTIRIRRGDLVREHRVVGQLVPDATRLAVVRAPRPGLLESPAWPVPGTRLGGAGTVGFVREWAGVGERVQIQVETNAMARDMADAEAAMLRAEARRTLARRVLARFAGTDGVVLGTARDAADRDLAEAEADLAAARRRLATLRAIVRPGPAGAGPVPIVAQAGLVISRVLARPGEGVTQGQPLLECVDPGRLWFQAQVPEAVLADFSAGAAAVVTLDVAPDAAVTAELVGVPPALDPISRHALVPFRWKGATAPLGAAGRLTLRRVLRAGRLLVPETALRQDGDKGDFVIVKTGAERFSLVAVRVGQRSGGQAEIVSGLESGSRVVVQGVQAVWTQLRKVRS
ncbi:MAG: HlyD family efflux transporter periplasmic adaptor subunit [Candidatus Sericytochromatia bacterium]|nr:HlyD family efflux transporter periplasmic adaptor subunit [Candidatus Sericytochromatia bacterium]